MICEFDDRKSYSVRLTHYVAMEIKGETMLHAPCNLVPVALTELQASPKVSPVANPIIKKHILLPVEPNRG